MKTNGGVEVNLQEFLSSALDKSRRPPDIDGSCEYIEQTTMDGRQGVVIQFGGWTWG
jgi:SH3-like domain-containing protein